MEGGDQLTNFNHGRKEGFSENAHLTKQNAPPYERGTLENQISDAGIRKRLLFVMHYRSRCLGSLDFMELRERAQWGGLRLSGAAAGGGQHSENGSDKSGKYANHGIKCFKSSEGF